MIKHMISIDLEDWYSDVEKVKGNFSKKFESQSRSIVKYLTDHDTKCTFFVLGKTAERYPEFILELFTLGHEIASHGYIHQRLDRITPKQFELDLDHSVKVLHDIVGKNPVGYRAPFFSLNRQVFWAYDILVERGFQYSSSIFPFYGTRFGIGDFSIEPQIINTSSGRFIYEIPLTVLKFCGWRFPIAGGGFWRVMPKFAIAHGIRSIEREGRRFVMYLHPHEFDTDRLISDRGILRNAYVNFGRSSIPNKFEFAIRDFLFQPIRDGIPLK